MIEQMTEAIEVVKGIRVMMIVIAFTLAWIALVLIIKLK